MKHREVGLVLKLQKVMKRMKKGKMIEMENRMTWIRAIYFVKLRVRYMIPYMFKVFLRVIDPER